MRGSFITESRESGGGRGRCGGASIEAARESAHAVQEGRTPRGVRPSLLIPVKDPRLTSGKEPLDEETEWLLDELPESREPLRGDDAVHGPVVDREGHRDNRADAEGVVVEHDRHLAGRADREDR